MPLLVSAGRRVVALDPRGMGDSDHPQTGYDMTSVAADVHGLVESIGLTDSDSLDVVGHDVGSWIGYAYASDWPKDVKRLTVLDAALPGITLPPPPGIPSAESNVKTWHFAFNRLDDLPEILIRGREREFLTWLFRSKATRAWTIDSDDLEEYIRVNATPGALRAAGSYYRSAFSPEGIAQNRARAEKLLTIPVLAFGSEMGTGDGMLRAMQQVTIAAQGGVFKGIGHYIPEECPQLIADELVAFFQKADF
jgi:pimeloyl-ACP methyl ester carboxylesterase